MSDVRRLFANNRAWAESLRARDPEFFPRLSAGQAPPYLWVGCSDSRVPSSGVLDLGPGEIFTHRNIANQAAPGDPSFQAVLQFAVDSLKVRHVIVCGHTSCGGVKGALLGGTAGPLHDWLGPLRDLAARHREELDALPESERADRLAELNVAFQVERVCASAPVLRAWEEGRPLAVHGLLYRLHDGLLQDLGLTREGPLG